VRIPFGNQARHAGNENVFAVLSLTYCFRGLSVTREAERMNKSCTVESAFWTCMLAGLLLVAPAASKSQTPAENRNAESRQTDPTGNFHQRLPESSKSPTEETPEGMAPEYRIGINDLLEISVFDAPELNRAVRVAANGEVSMPLIGTVPSGGLTARELEEVLETRLRQYMKDPHVAVFVSAIESHPVSVLGAVRKPGVFQVRGPKSILEVLSMAEGLADDAGNTVLVTRGAYARQPAGGAQAHETTGGASASEGEQTVRVDLKDLLQSEDPRLNITVYPGDIVKVIRAGVVYVVGEVKKPGGFVLKNNERMSVLKAIALAEGLTPTSAKGSARIIRGDLSNGERQEVPINLGKILAGKAPDPTLGAADIVFVPNNAGKHALYKGSEAAISALTSLLIFRW